jgi:hypothetical protein
MASNKHTEELQYEDYQLRQYAEIEPNKLFQRAEKIHFGNKFRYQNGEWEMIPYLGYALLSMVNDNPGNENLAAQLADIQNEIIKQTQLSHKLFPLPVASFHQTIANTLSDDRYYNHIIKAGLETKYPEIISHAISKITPIESANPISMRLIGLSLFGSALGILGVFEKEADFQRILHFRNQFYNNEDLNAIGVIRTRPFIGHITLLYFSEDISTEDGKVIANTCMEINKQIKFNDLYFKIHHTQLRQYEHLAHYNYQPIFPTYSFVK